MLEGCVEACQLSRAGDHRAGPAPAGQDWQYILPLLSTQVPQLLPSGWGAQVQLSAKAALLESAAATITTAKHKPRNVI
jgi:hypothetical protein